jgi:hypothetical protein
MLTPELKDHKDHKDLKEILAIKDQQVMMVQV